MSQKNLLLLVLALLILGFGAYWLVATHANSNQYFHVHAAQLARENTNYRNVLHTTKRTELTLMSIPEGTDIPTEIHEVDQIFFIVKGTANALIKNDKIALSEGSVLIVPAHTQHTIINTGSGDLKLYTVYAPPEHKVGTVHKTKEDEPKE